MEANKIDNGKLVGKIYSFDGEVGTIITSSGEYLFNVKDAKFDNIAKGTMVEFYSNIFPFGDEKYKLAREVNILTPDKGHPLIKGRP